MFGILLTLLAVDPAPPTVRVIHTPVLDPVTLHIIGGLDEALVTMREWPSHTTALFGVRTKAFDLDAAFDTRLAATRVQVKVQHLSRLKDTGAWEVLARPDSTLALLSGAPGLWRIGFLREQQVPVPVATVVSSEELPLEPTGPRFGCTIYRVHATASLASPPWSPPSYLWTFHRAEKLGDWTRVWGESRGVVVFGWVTAADFDCDAGSCGGFGVNGSSGVAEGVLEARRVVLPQKTALVTSQDGGSPIALLHDATEALMLGDGSLRLEVKSGNTRLTLHDLYATTAVWGSDKGSPRKVGHGSATSTIDNWPFVCPDDGGSTLEVCYGTH